MAEEKKDSVILVPKDYADGIIEHPHQAVKGEAVVTCNMVLRDPQKLVGQKATCPGCAQVFDVVQGGA